ncbi:hypothetical protein [Stenotrophomonas maltophilia]|uniref:hypothetical protein n=1 Tax=Stenotrophomonas maltophilia TaxID=40324 RepID=UPI0015DF93CF|nr:hypothetical protein [Stenotrophomonas maltophilia]MBA0284439.1 hypothetical protein [Stenotrophomonas maltophilia]MBA0323706.1 hypothetical protein [Stenotrophomonas maltophilia]
METQLLRDIRALLISKRARELQSYPDLAKVEGDVQVTVGFDGREVRTLTLDSALRLAVIEMENAREVIDEYSAT